MQTLAFIQNLSGWELLVILAIGLLLFGKRLPDVGRSLGKGIVEFKKGLRGLEDEVETQSRKDANPYRPAAQALPSESERRTVSRVDAVETPAAAPTPTTGDAR